MSTFGLCQFPKGLKVAGSRGESRSVPQLATTLLEPAIDAIRLSEGGEPVDSWLRKWGRTKHSDERTGILRDEQIRQIRSLLLFLGVLSTEHPQQLDSKVLAWRSDRRTLVDALVENFRRAYAAAGCDKANADLIGDPKLGATALRRVLAEEEPFLKLGTKESDPSEKPPVAARKGADTGERKSGAVDNAIRFAVYVHRRIVEDDLVPREEPTHQSADHRKPSSSESDSPIQLHDWGTVVSARRYRLQRVAGDRWIYGIVHFESPVGVTDRAWSPGLADPENQARLLEQLAAALLNEADAPVPMGHVENVRTHDNC